MTLTFIDLLGVPESRIYKWSSYTYFEYPLVRNRKRLLRLWYYYMRNHKGRGNHAAQATTRELNYVKIGGTA